MKLYTLFFMLMGLSYISSGQVTFIAVSIPANTPPDEQLYIAGNFNNWEPGNPDFVMHKNAQGKWEITLAFQPEGTTIQFKFNRGSWATVEKGANGEEISNRNFTYGNGETINVTILNWAGGGTNPSTAAANVSIMDESFFMPQLNRYRRIRIYYPPDYEISGKHYPVLYMHDGQNLFDNKTSYAGEWEVDETLNQLFEQGYEVPIVVGIDNGGIYRLEEYTPWINPAYGGGRGALYLQFIVETLKPHIDAGFRTLPDRENTGIMGSSLGGLISHFGSLQYPEVFGKAGVFSPSYWFSDSVWTFTANAPFGYAMRIYQMCGSAEGSNTDANMLRMSDSLIASGLPEPNIRNVVIQGGQHNEALWREQFRAAFLWLFHGETSSLNEHETGGWMLYPNPVGEQVFIQHPEGIFPCTIVVFNQSGKIVRELVPNTTGIYNMSMLSSGHYMVAIHSGNKTIHLKFVKQ